MPRYQLQFQPLGAEADVFQPVTVPGDYEAELAAKGVAEKHGATVKVFRADDLDCFAIAWMTQRGSGVSAPATNFLHISRLEPLSRLTRLDGMTVPPHLIVFHP